MVKKTKKTFEENLKDDIYFRYNLLLKLEEIKRIQLLIHEILRYFLQRFIQEDQKDRDELKKEIKEERGGTFKSK